MKYTLKQTLLCTVALVPTLAFAQADDTIALSPIMVYGGLLPTTLAATGATIEVVDAEDLKKSGPGVADALARLPGVSLSANGGLGTRSTLPEAGWSAAQVADDYAQCAAWAAHISASVSTGSKSLIHQVRNQALTSAP